VVYYISAQRPAAIVTPHAGTTRDVVQLSLDLGGFPMLLADTAGLRHSEDDAERQGVQRARSLASQADLVLLVAEAPQALKQGSNSLAPYLQDYIQQCQLDIRWQDCLVILNKVDLLPGNLKVCVLFNSANIFLFYTQSFFFFFFNTVAYHFYRTLEK
jgi:tRNA modification GTPase